MMKQIILVDSYSAQFPRLDEIMQDCIQRFLKLGILKSPQVNNDIPEDLRVYNNAQLVGRVLHNLLQSVLLNSQQHQIRITAKSYSDVVLIHLRDADGLDDDLVRPAILEMQSCVEELGGFLDITSHRGTESTIAFSFPNLLSQLN